MKTRHLLVVGIGLSALLPSFDIQAAMLSVSIDGQSMNVPVHWDSTVSSDGSYVIGNPGEQQFTYSTDGGSIQLSGALDPDPSLLFGSVAIDFGAPSTFSYTFMLPIVPPFSNPSRVLDSFSGSVTNGAAAGGVTVTALAPPPGIPTDGDGITEMQVYTLSDDGGVTWKNVGLDLGPSATIPLGSFGSGLYGNFNEGPIATIPGGPWTNIRADINFQLSGGGDTFTFNGAKSLIPEPNSIVIVVSALAPMCRGRRRRLV